LNQTIHAIIHWRKAAERLLLMIES
jgi:hypothetical protein